MQIIFKYLYQCADLKVFNRVRAAGSLHGIEILASRKYLLVMSEKLIPIRKINNVRIYTFAELDIDELRGFAELWS